MNLLQTSNGLCKRYQFITLQSLGNTSKLIIILYTVPLVLSRTYRNITSLIVGASLSNSECTIYVLIWPHSPSDITLLYKSKGQKDDMNTFQSALKSVLCNLYQNGWYHITCFTGILHWTRDLLQLYYHSYLFTNNIINQAAHISIDQLA